MDCIYIFHNKLAVVVFRYAMFGVIKYNATFKYYSPDYKFTTKAYRGGFGPNTPNPPNHNPTYKKTKP